MQSVYCLSKPESAYHVSMNVYSTKVLTQQLFALVCIAYTISLPHGDFIFAAFTCEHIQKIAHFCQT